MTYGVAKAIEPAQTAQSENRREPIGPAALWTGRILSGLVGLFLLFDAAMKLVKPEFVVKGTTEIGFPENTIVPLGIVLLSCTLIYLLPRTAVLGAILLTGYLGGAVAAHVRHEDGAFPVVFCVIFGAVIWTGLPLRDERVRLLLPWRR